MKKILMFLIISFIVFFGRFAYAQIPTEMSGFLENINSNLVMQNIVVDKTEYAPFEEKYSNGMINIASSWVEIPEGVARTAQEENILVAGTIGLGKGIISGIGRLIFGTYELATFPISPEEEPLMEAKYKVENPQEGFKIDILNW